MGTQEVLGELEKWSALKWRRSSLRLGLKVSGGSLDFSFGENSKTCILGGF